MKKIIFATGNKAKIAQMQFIINFFNFPIKIIKGKEIFSEKASYEEMGNSVKEIALNGALSVSKRMGLPVITEDTDLQIKALNNEPGIRAGFFLKNFGRSEILKRMKGIKNRDAVITSAIAYATPSGEYKIFTNKVEGKIAEKEKSGKFPDWISPTKDNPFGGGYNAIFIPKGWNKTLAEISPEESIPWSYREKNFIAVIKYILSIS